VRILPAHHMAYPQPPEGAPGLGDGSPPLRNLQSALEERRDLMTAAAGVSDHLCERDIELQLERLVGLGLLLQGVQRALQVFPIFAEEAQLEPDGRRGRGELQAERRIAGRAETPVESGANIMNSA